MMPALRRIPFILMTNGGGVTEHLRALALSRLLDYPVRHWCPTELACVASLIMI